MTTLITVAQVGLGGYGNHYLDLFFKSGKLDGIKLVAGIDPDPKDCTFLEDIKNARIPIFPDLESFCRQASADLIIISTPIHLREPMTCQALAHGSNVLCEKPLAATVAEAESMLEAERNSNGKQVAIGYQWSYSPAIIRLKNDILNGRLGKAKKLKTAVLWPRNASYYARAPWAGKIKLAGRWVMDSPLANATAHYLHNMLYLLGRDEHLSAIPATLDAETYRAKDIENFDTAMLRCSTENREEILFYTSHSVNTTIGPLSHFEFENGTVLYSQGAKARMIATFGDGSHEDYGNPNDFPEAKVASTANAIREKTAFRCGIKAASPHLQIVNAIQQTHEEIHAFPESYVQKTPLPENDCLVHVSGMEDVMLQCYAAGILPHEHKTVEWSKPPQTIVFP